MVKKERNMTKGVWLLSDIKRIELRICEVEQRWKNVGNDTLLEAIINLVNVSEVL